jgi:hypothetical protein
MSYLDKQDNVIERFKKFRKETGSEISFSEYHVLVNSIKDTETGRTSFKESSSWDTCENVDRQGGSFSASELNDTGWH